MSASAVAPTPPSPQRPGAAEDGSAAFALDAVGMVHDCSGAERLFGYRHDELIGRHVSLLLPQLAATRLLNGDRVNARFAYLCRCGIRYQALRRDGSRFAGMLVINLCGNAEARRLVLYVRDAGARAPQREAAPA